MNKLHAHTIGIVFGGVFALLHAVWALLVLMGWAKPLLDWIFDLHFMNMQYSIDPFSFGTALMLVIVTGIIGYLTGYVFGWLWNLAHRTAHKR